MSLRPTTDGERQHESEQGQPLLRLVEHLRAEAVKACEAVAATGRDASWWSEHAAWLAMLTQEDCVSVEDVPAVGRRVRREVLDRAAPEPPSPALDEQPGSDDGAWSTERCLTWIAKNRALLRVLTTQDGGNEVLVSVRPASHPDDVLMVQRPCAAVASLADIAAAVEETACMLSADENRRKLRLVWGEPGPENQG